MSHPRLPKLADDPNGERLTLRARAYLLVAVGRHAAVGVLCILNPRTFTGGSFDGIKRALEFVDGTNALLIWGSLFIVTSVVCFVAAIGGREQVARWGLLLSVVFSGFWVGGYVASWFEGTLTSLIGPIVWTALAIKDSTMLRSPLRNPFEPLRVRILDRAKG